MMISSPNLDFTLFHGKVPKTNKKTNYTKLVTDIPEGQIIIIILIHWQDKNDRFVELRCSSKKAHEIHSDRVFSFLKRPRFQHGVYLETQTKNAPEPKIHQRPLKWRFFLGGHIQKTSQPRILQDVFQVHLKEKILLCSKNKLRKLFFNKMSNPPKNNIFSSSRNWPLILGSQKKIHSKRSYFSRHFTHATVQLEIAFEL